MWHVYFGHIQNKLKFLNFKIINKNGKSFGSIRRPAWHASVQKIGGNGDQQHRSKKGAENIGGCYTFNNGHCRESKQLHIKDEMNASETKKESHSVQCLKTSVYYLRSEVWPLLPLFLLRSDEELISELNTRLRAPHSTIFSNETLTIHLFSSNSTRTMYSLVTMRFSGFN